MKKKIGFLKLDKDLFLKLDLNKIAYIVDRGNHSDLYNEFGEKTKCQSPLKQIEVALPFGFERANKNYIINMEFVETVFLNTNVVTLSGEVIVKINESFKSNLKKYMITQN